MAIKERHLRNATLPVAILCGLLFHKFLSSFYPLVPWLLAAMMLQTCTKISISKMRVRRVHLMLLAVQVFVSIGLPPTSTVGQPGIHEVISGVQGIGAIGTIVHIPKGVTTFSSIVPTGILLKV